MNKEKEILNELVYQAIGEASMCWNETPKGVFNSYKAKDVSERLIKEILEHFELKKCDHDMINISYRDGTQEYQCKKCGYEEKDYEKNK